MKNSKAFSTTLRIRMKVPPKMLQNLLITMLLLAIVGLIWWISVYFKNQANAIPQSVRNEYVKVSAEYKESLGSSVLKCPSDKGEIYLVTGSGGYTEITYYFDLLGNNLGSYESSDLQVGVRQKPPAEVQYDSCKTLLSQNQPETQK